MTKTQKRRLKLTGAALGVSLGIALLVGCCVWVATASLQKAFAAAVFTELLALIFMAVFLWGTLLLEWLAAPEQD